MNRTLRNLSCVFAAGVLALGTGCAKTGESANRDQLTANVGVYPPPPGSNPVLRAAVPPFLEVAAPGNFSGDKQQLARIAGDQLTTLLDQTRRFEMVERTQVQQLLAEQNMEGIVRPDQMAKAGQVLGAQYLLIGKITSFRIKQEATETGINAGGLGGLLGGRFGGGETGYNQKNVQIKTQVGVDLRLVDPTNGKILVSKFSEFDRVDSAESLGINVMGFGGKNDAQIQVTEDDAGRVLRLAFDDAIKKMLPELDAKIAKLTKSPAAAPGTVTQPAKAPATPVAAAAAAEVPVPVSAPAVSAPAVSAPAVTPSAVSAKKFCPDCGEAIPAGARFCPKDGTKIE
ncbi:CsgG/HfaB family protein [Humisphaera borealis]|uniref:Zinc-ribbon domain-containing protein n=1 Tax=Humisphaera borealis TaxID=2807512 RepID=A0A7M2WWX8_9BACT|nr:CsgG/HfaB family protein [Humisphaera borealis]QOV89702.1 hypothetical protein IPV69_26530 [Humisphaera borealis]